MTLTKKKRSFEDNQNEQKNEDTEQINDALDPAPKDEEPNDPAPKDEEPNIDKPPISVDEKTPGKKVKKFACEICVDKKFTTKQSLKIFHKTFHDRKHSIKETEVHPEVRYPNTSLPATERKASFIQEPESKNLKRKFQHNPDNFHLIRDNLVFSRDEPVIKLPKHTEFTNIEEQRGVNRKVPKQAKVKRKFDDNTDDFERYERRADEPVVKLPKYTEFPDSTQRKRFHWESFSHLYARTQSAECVYCFGAKIQIFTFTLLFF